MTIIILILFFLFSFYHQLNKRRRNSLFGNILYWFNIGLITWICLLPLALKDENNILIAFWVGVIPVSYIYFLLNLFWFVPQYDKKGQRVVVYMVEQLILVILLFLIFLRLFLLIYKVLNANYNFSLDLNSLLSLVYLATMIASLSLSWIVYKNRKDKMQRLLNLQKELGNTTSNLQFLRSQINPHFLFNALNTLYGISIQENAAKTGDGIQRLGDMMRFMLKDNQKTMIPLGNEIGYLKNYVYLQQLRLENTENIHIDVHIYEPVNEYLIAPMLLVPFVENAFKHGISLQESSWININLHCGDDNCLYFEVKNSVHERDSADTERKNTGIGLENVKERLKLLYPERHELSIHKNGSEFIVHLTLTLDEQMK